MKLYKLVGADGKTYESKTEGAFGGNRRSKVYGKLRGCPSATRALKRGDTYKKNRVFFADAQAAQAAGYRPCGSCLSKEYEAWKRAQEASAFAAELRHFSESVFSIDELAQALIDGQRWANDSRDGVYFAKRRDAFRGAFGLDAPSKDVRDDTRYAASMLKEVLELATVSGNPFAGMMEAPQVINELYQAHGAGLRAADEALKKEQHALLRSTLERMVQPGRTVTGKELISFGYDLSLKPAPVDEDDW